MSAVRATTATEDLPSSPSRVQGWISRHQLAAFFTIAFLISWSLWGIGYLGGGMAFVVLGAFGPMAAGALVSRARGASIRDWLASITRIRVPPRFYAYALGIPILLYGMVNLELALFGRDVDVSLVLDRWPAYMATLVSVALVGGGQEEPGWRGFALPQLQMSRSPLKATLILGLLWGLWHVPLYGPLGFAVPLLLAPFYTYLFNRTGSVVPCLMLHGSFTAAQGHLTLLAHDSHGLTDASIGATYLLAGALLVLLTRGRIGAQEESKVNRKTTRDVGDGSTCGASKTDRDS